MLLLARRRPQEYYTPVVRVVCGVRLAFLVLIEATAAEARERDWASARKTLAPSKQLMAANRRHRPERQTGGCPVPWTDVPRL